MTVLYLRKSNDPHDTRASVDRQETYCRDLAARMGLPAVSQVFVDNDISAAGDAIRPDFERMLRSLSGVDVIVAWEVERLYRKAGDMERLFSAAERAGAKILTGGGWLDPERDSDYLSGGMGAVVGQHEVRRIRRRVNDAMAANAIAGRPHGPVAYGWDREWTVDGAGRRHFKAEQINPQEAAVVRESARRFLIGESLRSISANFNARGIPAPNGGRWENGRIRVLLQRERNVGHRVHRGQVIGDAVWDPILDEGTFARVVAKLDDPARRTVSRGGPGHVHLLSGIAICGVCGAPMRAAKSKGVPKYVCDGRGCTSRGEADVDKMVIKHVLFRLSEPDAPEALTPDDSETEERVTAIAVLQARLDSAADLFAAGDVDAAGFKRMTAGVKQQIDALDAQRRRATGKPASLALAGPDAAELWEDATIDQKRTVVTELTTVTIMRTRKGARTFDPDSVRIDPTPARSE